MPPQSVKKLTTKQIPLLKSRISSRQLRLNKDVPDEDTTVPSANVQQWMKRRSSVWLLDNQNPFVDKELMEEVTKTLTTENPQVPTNLVEFSFKEETFVPVTNIEKNIILIDLESACLPTELQESEKQTDSLTDDNEEEKTDISDITSVIAPSAVEPASSESTKDVVDEGSTGDEAEDEDVKDEKSERSGSVALQEVPCKTSKKLMNQFNFCERATMTYNNPLRDVGTQTIPGCRLRFCECVTQWIIYDSYKEDYEWQQKERDRGKKEKLAVQVPRKDGKRKQTVLDTSGGVATESLISSVFQAAVVLQRMINQNMFEDILYDFRYYEDPSDEYKEREGTLLPLWNFQFNDSKQLHVTDIKWHPRYFDLFAVTFGSFDFQKQCSAGYFSLWSLKNPSDAEYSNRTECGVMCIDFHRIEQYLVVLGLYDGSVAVYNVKDTVGTDKASPVYRSNSVGRKHDGIVWQVEWGDDLSDGEMVFYSVSSDGKVFSWLLMRNELSQTLVINMEHEQENSALWLHRKPIGSITNSGTCIALHPKDRSIFLIGTEEGDLYKCSMSYISTYLFTYKAHHMPIHRIAYNIYSPDIFVSCSADWNIKIWEDNRREPLFVFNVGSAVSDVKWAPYSSTVLAAITTECKVYIYDLNIDKYKPICTQTVVSKKQHKLTRIAFNWKLPVIIVGNDRGCVTSLKLSPNLRKKQRISKKQQETNLFDLEVAKLEKVLSLVREPSSSIALLKPSKQSSLTSSSV